MGKMCSFARHTTFMKNGIAEFECKVVKSCKNRCWALLLGAEFLARWHDRSCLNHWEKPPRPSGILEDGNLLNNFGTQSSGHFYFEI
jgi:hypothetical protein